MSFPFSRFSFLVCILVLLLLTGCAGPKNTKKQLTFWPDADLPRVQFLMEINSNADVLEMEKKFSLVSFEQPEKVQFDPLIKPTGVTVHKGIIYICDAGRTAVFAIDLKNKTFEKIQGIGRGSFGKPLNVAFDSDDNMYIADVNRRDIMVLDSERNFLRGIGQDVDMKPTDVGIDGDYVIVTDMKNNEIKIFDRTTDELVGAFGQEEALSKNRLSIPTHMEVDTEGFIHITNAGNGRILKYDRDGHLLQGFGGLGANFAHFGRPRGITTDDAGNIYVVDAAHQNVQVFNEKGRLLMFFGGGEEMTLPAGIAISKENLDFFQTLAAPNFELDSVIMVTNHFGEKRLAIYGFGKRRGIDYEKEYEKIRLELEERIRREKEEAEAKKQQSTES